ncbi:MAG TPA: periplasmic heavy metal sensor [Gemmatimonadales bacterium]|nr:periplasmic heavy metal sensor [Gemmatimonadales bacterium]
MQPRSRLLPTVLLVSSLIAAPLVAQNAGGPPPGGMGGPPGGGRPMMDPTLIDGPMMPEEFTALASLDAAQEKRYESIYQALMSSTRSDRAELQAAREKRRQAMSSGGQVDREAMRAEREKMRPLYENLQKQQESFDKALKEFLKPEQLRKYEAWKEQKREEMRAQFGGGRRP